MSFELDVQEIAIVLSAQKHDPTLLNLEFLRHSGIVPGDWELAREPIRTTKVSQVAFANGCSVVAQQDRVVFTEALGAKPIGDVMSPDIAKKYSNVLSHVNYQGVGINFRSFVAFNGDKNAARRYLTTHFLSSSTWQDIGDESMRASLNLVFTFGEKRLTLNISEASLKLTENESVPVILCTGNFSKDLSSLQHNELMRNVSSIINEWNDDLDNYKTTIVRLLEKEQDQFVPITSIMDSFNSETSKELSSACT